MLNDRYGLEVSTSSVEARDSYVEAIDRMLAADGYIEDVLAAAIAADPDFSLPHIALARQHQLNGRAAEARAAAEVAVGLADGATDRERRHVEIMNLTVTGKIPQALELSQEHLKDHPRDAFVLAPACGVFGSIGFSGRIGREEEQLAFLAPFATHYGDDWWFQMVHAFALLETGEWTRGRELAERSLELRPDCSHGAHTLTHALYEAGAVDEALGFLGDWIPASDRASLMHCHNWWHYSMLLMMTGQQEAADTAFTENCLPGSTDSPAINVFTDAASYLWCSELAGVPRNRDHWQTVREYYEEQFRRPIVFVDAHVSLPYVALGDAEQFNACVAELEELGEAGRLPAENTAAMLARAYDAFESKQWGTVIELLESDLAQVVRIGGSRAQRDLQTNTLLAAYVNDGRHDAAEAFLSSVVDRQPARAVAGLAQG